jgi:hypothetical protein
MSALIFQHLKSVRDTFTPLIKAQRVASKSLVPLFEEKVAQWHPDKIAKIKAHFSPTMHYAHAAISKTDLPDSLRGAFQDGPQKFYLAISMGIDFYESMGRSCFGVQTLSKMLKKLMRTRINLEELIANYRLLGADENTEVRVVLNIYERKALPALDNAIKQLQDMTGWSDQERAAFKETVIKDRLEGIDHITSLQPFFTYI